MVENARLQWNNENKWKDRRHIWNIFPAPNKNGEYVEVGDPLTFMMEKAGNLWELASKIVGGDKGKGGDGFESNN